MVNLKHFHLKFFYSLFLLFLILTSCKKNEFERSNIEDIPVFPKSEVELRQIQINKDVASILQYVYQDRKAYYEVNAAIYSEYYDDESVMLRDLIFPETSPLYKREEFKAYKSPEGVFKTRFFEALALGNYPTLKEAMGLNTDEAIKIRSMKRFNTQGQALSAAAPADTTIEVYSNSSGTSIYFPYSENFGSRFTTAYFDAINKSPSGNTATIVAADREANSGPGNEPYICGTRTTMKLCYTIVTVNDAYAELNETHIVGGGADIMCHNGCTPADPLPAPSITRVFIGWVRMSGTQTDNFISLSKANGGGSELKIGRGSGYLKFTDEQVTNWDGDVITPDKKFKRKDIKKGRWRALYSAWDDDWKAGNTQQVLAMWEDDNKGTQTFNGSLSTTLKKRADGNSTTGTIGYSISVVSQDAVLRQYQISRSSYIASAKSDQGCGFIMTDDKGSRQDSYFLPAGSFWPVYDCNNIVGFTLPYHIY